MISCAKESTVLKYSIFFFNKSDLFSLKYTGEQKMKILLVEDLAFSRTRMKVMLEENGYTDILEAATAESALDVFEAEKPDVVILDLILPDRKDLSVLIKMRAIHPEASVAICSAMTQPTVIRQALEMGACEYLVKPVDAEKLLKLIEDHKERTQRSGAFRD